MRRCNFISTVELSLYLQKDIEGLTLSTTTSSSEEIIDQYDPLVNDLEPVLKIRHASAVHIKIINGGVYLYFLKNFARQKQKKFNGQTQQKGSTKSKLNRFTIRSYNNNQMQFIIIVMLSPLFLYGQKITIIVNNKNQTNYIPSGSISIVESLILVIWK
ncbi:hypothetical protein ACTFIW_007962 [Dictyostelium discoideum]